MIISILLDSLIDAAKLLPILFAIYLLVEYLEHKNNNFVHGLFEKSKKSGPILGALFGTIPQCGFSVIASELFSKKAISVGTLIAVFVATSDEAIPLMLAHPDRIYSLLGLLLLKFVIAGLSGLLIDFAVKSELTPHLFHEEDEHHFHGNCESCDDGILKSAIIHSVRIFVFIFVVSVVLGIFTEYLSPFMEFIENDKLLQILLAPLFGIIPNCAASVVLTEMFLAGKITFAALCGGLCTGAGVGLLVLFKQNKNRKQNLSILLTVYIIGVVSGLFLLYV